VRSLSDAECSALRSTIAQRLGLKSGTDGLTLVKSVVRSAKPVEGVNAKSSDFRLDRVVWAHRVQLRPTVYLNWYRFDRIDEIDSADLTHYFSDFWYPDSDDIEILDESCDWILVVSHSGDLSVLQPPHRSRWPRNDRAERGLP
jgi:hypothetical protein